MGRVLLGTKISQRLKPEAVCLQRTLSFASEIMGRCTVHLQMSSLLFLYSSLAWCSVSYRKGLYYLNLKTLQNQIIFSSIFIQ